MESKVTLKPLIVLSLTVQFLRTEVNCRLTFRIINNIVCLYKCFKTEKENVDRRQTKT